MPNNIWIHVEVISHNGGYLVDFITMTIILLLCS